jgi:hypothetical protein
MKFTEMNNIDVHLLQCNSHSSLFLVLTADSFKIANKYHIFASNQPLKYIEECRLLGC